MTLYIESSIWYILTLQNFIQLLSRGAILLEKVTLAELLTCEL